MSFNKVFPHRVLVGSHSFQFQSAAAHPHSSAEALFSFTWCFTSAQIFILPKEMLFNEVTYKKYTLNIKVVGHEGTFNVHNLEENKGSSMKNNKWCNKCRGKKKQSLMTT